MDSIFGLFKAEYVFQPGRLVRRLAGVRAPSGAPAPCVLPLPWDVSIEMRAFDGRAREIDRLGIHDLVVTESLWRLLRPGATVVDAGANVGYMTLAAMAALGSSGRLFAFEPHPALFEELSANVRRGHERFPNVEVITRREALSDRDGSAWLSQGEDWDRTRGTARLAPGGAGFTVPTRRLDDYADELGPVELMKVDVEGHEPALLRGASAMLRRGRIRHIVFEEHGRYPTEATTLLEGAGYSLFSLERSLLRVRLGRASAPVHPRWQPPSFLATLEPKRACDAFRGLGWRSLARAGRRSEPIG